MRFRFWWAAVAALLIVGIVVLPTLAVAPAGGGADLAAAGKAHPTRKPKPTPTATPVVTPSPTVSPTASPTSSPAIATLVGAGDIASCASTGDEATALLLDGIAGTVFTAGDDAYESGSSTEFSNCYGPTWGRHKARTRPAIGNHEYARACVVAFWHHPRFSSGPHGSDATVQPFWQALYDANADLVVVGHDHDYERFAPQTPTGALDPARGMVEFVVGTGGRSHYAFATTQPNRLAGNDTTYGVLRLDLSAGGYAFSFIPVAGATFTDSGTGTCH